MADKKISALTAATTPLAGTEVLPIVQGGSTVKVSVANLTAGRAVGASTVTATGQVSGNYLTASGNVESTGPNLGHAPNRIIMSWEGGAGAYFQSYGPNASTIGEFSFRQSSSDASITAIGLQIQGGNVLVPVGNVTIGTAGKGIDFSASTHAAGMTSELLNDYEEGVWTGTLTGDAAAPTTPVTASGRYTRIGRQVTAQISLFNVNTTGASGVLLITGLPFSSSAERAYGSCFFIGMGSAVATAHIQSADNRISFLDAVTGAYINISAGAGKYVGASITYTV
jgi:hypothetical protein